MTASRPNTDAASSTTAPSKPAIKPHLMTSTWHLQDPSTWNFWQRMLVRLDLLQQPKDAPKAPIRVGEKVPYYPAWRQHAWIFPRAAAPLVIHYAYMRLTGWTLHPVAAFFFYVISFKLFAVASVRKFNRMALRYGYFDGMAPRDGVPDTQSRKVVLSLLGTISIRPLFALCVAYDRHALPSLSWYFPLQLFLYACILDFFFYWYHRATHEVSWAWRYHKKHHMTKHPNPLLSAFADEEQEWGDILIIPFLTWLCMPVDFSTWWMCTSLRPWGCAHVLADDDDGLHLAPARYGPLPRRRLIRNAYHRRGSKKSGNYGKQTRLWDALFGTKMPRQEWTEEAIDWDNTAW
ncbi:related to ERG25 - C-4 methyl sterol oxidase [Pseudozyma flocculosa]|uniref:Related to ERG25 - C-4 methyl sterol oxidase n=1 Tax=Pseudozyma flocculosa TaxID=84751 RepID=A0A5C3EYH3_9BASI|nr:related to ERG25 - C-4 methyl sterol oxidase [Pseudozyma flocculosa]